MPVYEVKRDRHGLMYSGPLEVGECVKVTPLLRNGDGDFEDPYARLRQYDRELDESVDEVERLRADLERLRELLTEAVHYLDSCGCDDDECPGRQKASQLRAALSGPAEVVSE